MNIDMALARFPEPALRGPGLRQAGPPSRAAPRFPGDRVGAGGSAGAGNADPAAACLQTPLVIAHAPPRATTRHSERRSPRPTITRWRTSWPRAGPPARRRALLRRHQRRHLRHPRSGGGRGDRRVMGARVERLLDVGVAGIHRLLDHRDAAARARSSSSSPAWRARWPASSAGWWRARSIAVPTSVGYGASFGGMAPLLAMLNSCAAGRHGGEHRQRLRRGFLAESHAPRGRKLSLPLPTDVLHTKGIV